MVDFRIIPLCIPGVAIPLSSRATPEFFNLESIKLSDLRDDNNNSLTPLIAVFLHPFPFVSLCLRSPVLWLFLDVLCFFGKMKQRFQQREETVENDLEPRGKSLKDANDLRIQSEVEPKTSRTSKRLAGRPKTSPELQR